MKYTEEEIKEFINVEYSALNLTEREFHRYVNFVKKINTYTENNRYRKMNDAIDYFRSNFEELYVRFIEEGYTPEASIELTRKAVLMSDRKELILFINFARAINIEEKAINAELLLFRKAIEQAHARKKYLTSINDYNHQTPNTLLKMTDNAFEKRFGVSMPLIIKKYPITDELIQVWTYQANLTDDNLNKEFNLTREEIARIYPTSINELATIKKLGNLTNEEIQKKYGISKDDLLTKHPLNTDTLRAIMSINISSERAIINTFGKTKEEVLKLKTITTDMIRIAKNNKVNLKHYTSEEIKEKLKSMKKGTVQNG